MSWNESGGGKNPWDRRGGGDGPPDLDRIVREWQQKFSSLFGGGRGGGGGRSENGGGSAALFYAAIVLVVLAWAATGFYRVDDAERGVVLRFGQYQESSMPGLRWHIPWPVEAVELVNVNVVNSFNQQTLMLTADENIVVVDLEVQFRKADPVAYLFNVRDPDATLSDVSESAIREVVGKSKMDFLLLEGRAEIALRTQDLVQLTLDDYGTGIIVTKVNLKDANFPSQVKDAVEDAIKAREDKERLGFEAQAYANDIVPKARGEAARRLQDAEAYKSRVTADAEGEAARFEKLLAEYEAAPEVTRERLYIESVEDVLGDASKVLMDADGSGNLVYLPLDKLMERGGGSSGGSSMGARNFSPRNGGEPVTQRDREDSRSRRVR